ncbi:unnamed protein product, partial [Prorocentrum cordatum]
VVLLNRAAAPCDVALLAPRRGTLRLQLPAHSFATVCWKAEAAAPTEQTTPRGEQSGKLATAVSGTLRRCSRPFAA